MSNSIHDYPAYHVVSGEDCDNIHVCASAKVRRLVAAPLCLMSWYNACMSFHRDSFKGPQTCQ
eukprot:12410010-Karenia_brevis.AAC.1